MANMFSAHEIVEIGVQIEMNGRDFYDEVLKNIKDEKIREIFEYLKEQEEEHISTFNGILESVHEYQPEGAYPEEYFVYMNTLASGHIFTEKDKGREVARKVSNAIEAIDKGIIFEKDSVVFYEGIKKVVPEKSMKIIDSLIEEEKKHLIKLVSLRKEIAKG